MHDNGDCHKSGDHKHSWWGVTISVIQRWCVIFHTTNHNGPLPVCCSIDDSRHYSIIKVKFMILEKPCM